MTELFDDVDDRYFNPDDYEISARMGGLSRKKGTQIMKTIFWNVDTQFDFMRDEGALYVQGAEKIDRSLARLTNLAKTKGIKVINTADWHERTSEEISDNPNYITTFPPHCIIGSKGANYIYATDPESPYKIDWRQDKFDKKEVLERRNVLLYKDKFDVFAGNPHTEEVVNIINPTRAVVYGVATNVCVDFAVTGLIERGVEVYVLTDAIKELPNLPLQEVFDKWVNKGAKLVTTKNLEEILK